MQLASDCTCFLDKLGPILYHFLFSIFQVYAYKLIGVMHNDICILVGLLYTKLYTADELIYVPCSASSTKLD
jgi:hypothetical protein